MGIPMGILHESSRPVPDWGSVPFEGIEGTVGQGLGHPIFHRSVMKDRIIFSGYVLSFVVIIRYVIYNIICIYI